VPLGLKVDLPKGWDVYAQVHPELNLYKKLQLQMGAAVGVKYSF
jgi:dUTPase